MILATLFLLWQVTFPPSGVSNSVVLCAGSGLSLTTSGTAKQTMVTCDIPAGTFPAGRTTLEAFFVGTHAANSNTTTTGITIAGIDIVARISAASAETIGAILTCMPSTSNALGCHAVQSVSSGTTSGNIFAGIVTPITFSSANTLQFFITTPVAAGDATLQAYRVRLLKE